MLYISKFTHNLKQHFTGLYLFTIQAIRTGVRYRSCAFANYIKNILFKLEILQFHYFSQSIATIRAIYELLIYLKSCTNDSTTILLQSDFYSKLALIMKLQ